MFRRILVIGMLSALLVAMLNVISLSPASAAGTRKCVTGTHSRTCWTRYTVYKHMKPVEAIPLENKSSRTVRMHCSFSRNITKTFEVGVTQSHSAKASLFGLVEGGTDLSLAMKVTQSKESASAAGGSIVLRPGERVTCLRTYGFVTTKIRERTVWFSAGGGERIRRFKVTVPAYLGVRIID